MHESQSSICLFCCQQSLLSLSRRLLNEETDKDLEFRERNRVKIRDFY